MRRMPRISEKKSGFTLVELLVAMAVGSIVVALVMTTYWTQTMTKKNQELVMEMQQNIRSALFFMQQDLMMAGYGDDPSLSVDATITVAQPTAVRFTFADPLCDEDNIDNDDDGETDEDNEKDGLDNNGDGHEDEDGELETIEFLLQGNEIHRRCLEADNADNERVREVIATNIENLEFLYSLADGTTTTAVTNQDDRDDIRKIGISILARSETEVSGIYKDDQTYRPLSFPLPGGDLWGPYNDNFRRQMLTTTVHCRNMYEEE